VRSLGILPSSQPFCPLTSLSPSFCRDCCVARRAGKKDEAADDEEDADGDSEMKQAAGEEKKAAPKAGQFSMAFVLFS
jgi:hypothetical protein